MLDIGTKLPAKPIADQAPKVTPAAPASKTVTKAGTIVVLSPTALKLNRDLQAVASDPDKDPATRSNASVQLRQLASAILTGD